MINSIILRMFSYFLNKTNIVKSIVLVIKNLTIGMKDILEAQTKLVKLEQESREAITELFNLYIELSNNVVEKPMSKSTQLLVERSQKSKKFIN